MTAAAMSSPMFGAAFIGQLQALKPVQPYQVTKLSGKIKKMIYGYKATGKFKTLKDGSKKSITRIEPSEVMEDAGFLVKFPNGHSIRISDEKELQRLGFHLEPGLVSLETGDVLLPNYEKIVSQMETLSLLGGGFVPEGNVKAEQATLVNLADGDIKKGGK